MNFALPQHLLQISTAQPPMTLPMFSEEAMTNGSDLDDKSPLVIRTVPCLACGLRIPVGRTICTDCRNINENMTRHGGRYESEREFRIR